MKMDTENPVVKLCIKGMEAEGAGDMNEALRLFTLAWEQAGDDFERYIAAHYLARRQESVGDKLKWDMKALHHALLTGNDEVKESYPSLYLNIAKCYEDMGDTGEALENFRLALSFAHYLPDDGYGKMIRGGIENGIRRLQ